MMKTWSFEYLLRRYMECLIVVWCPWVLLTEQEAEELAPRADCPACFMSPQECYCEEELRRENDPAFQCPERTNP